MRCNYVIITEIKKKVNDKGTTENYRKKQKSNKKRKRDHNQNTRSIWTKGLIMPLLFLLIVFVNMLFYFYLVDIICFNFSHKRHDIFNHDTLLN